MFSNLFGSIAASLFSDISVGGIPLGSLGRSLGKVTGNYLDDNFDDNLKSVRKNILSPLDLDRVTTTSDNADDTVPLLYGTVRVGGKIIWNSMMEQKVNHDHLFSGKWGILPTRSPDKYNYTISIAVALCEGEIDRITNIYFNDRMISTDIVTRLYTGTDSQTHDPLIAAYYGNNIPNFKHTAYVVIENIPIELYNKNLPNVTFDVVKGSEPKIEDSIKALCMIPASGEFVYATDLVQRDAEFSPIYENVHTPSFESDFSVTVKNLKNTYKNLKNVYLVVGWFFDHTDPAILNILPAVETRNKVTTPLIWSVANYNRQTAWLVSNYNNSPAYGGTPCDEAVKQGIIKLFQAGYKVTFYPFLFGDIVPNNPQNQPAYPWRGRIKPLGDSVQKQNAINRFFDIAGYSQMILHYANLCKQVNDIYPQAVDLFIIGSELRGLTQTKIGTGFPAVEKLRTLASQVRSILGTGVKLTYAADWSEGGSYNDTGSSLDFPLDRLWASTNIDYVGYDWYAPLTDWRDGDNHLDRQVAETDKDIEYLKSRIEGGEGYDWYYATDTDRNNQVRTPITDGQYNKPWVFRIKDIRNRWLNSHIRRTSSGFEYTPATSWIPQSKKIIFTELGCPAVNKGGNSPNLFPDIKSSENGIPPFSNGLRDDFIQRSVLKAYLDYWANDTAMIDTDRTAIWCVDARPYPVFPARADIWGDTHLFSTGHWIDGRGGFSDLKTIISDICNSTGVVHEFENFDNATIDGFIINKPMSAKDMLNYLTDLFDIRITHKGNILVFSNDKTVKTTITPDKIVRIKDNPQRAGQGALNSLINTQFNKRNNDLSTDLKKINFIEKNQNTNIPTQLQAYFLDNHNGGQKSIVTAEIPTDYTQNIFKMVLPIGGFGHDLKPFIQNYLYRLRASENTVSLFVYNQNLTAGDNVNYNNKPYRITSVKQTGYLAKLRLTLLYTNALAKIDTSTAQKNIDYALVGNTIKYVTVDTQKYIGLSVKPFFKEYHLYKTPVGGSIRTYVSSIKPTLIYGNTVTDFYNRPTGIVDTGHDLWITLKNGDSIKTVTPADIANGYNRLAIYNSISNLWELISFETAVLVDANINKYQLSKITRGLNNTASAIGSPLPTGAEVIIMNEALIQIDNGFKYNII